LNLDLFFEPNAGSGNGTLFLRVGDMKSFHGPMYQKRTDLYVKAYLLQNNQPTKDSKRSTDAVPRSEEIEFKGEFQWPVEAKSLSNYNVLVGIWGHGKLKNSIPLGEVTFSIFYFQNFRPH